MLLVALLILQTNSNARSTNTTQVIIPSDESQQISNQLQTNTFTLSAEEDHARIMRLLGIKELRRWRDGLDPTSPYYPNYDESKANPYPNLPDPLKLKSGELVTTASMWWDFRRPELIEDFEREIYGRLPANIPPVKWTVANTTNILIAGKPVEIQTLTGSVTNANRRVNIQALVGIPLAITSPVPLIIQIGFLPRRGIPTPPIWQQLLVSNGWGFAVLDAYSVQRDSGTYLTEGIIGLCNNGQPRPLEQWGALRAWAWGASRLLDYLETEKRIDATHVGIEGHSRFGKAALIAMTFDQRFAIVYASSSGAGGAKLLRRNWGETVENLASTGEYHWMAGNFLKYAGPLTWADLPVDAHELIALCAPQPVFITAGRDDADGWVDARGMFMAAVAATPVYKLLGAEGIETTNMPPLDTPLIKGRIGFCQHSGGHDDRPTWPIFIQFAQQFFTKPKPHTN